VENPTAYRTVRVDGLSIFYREAGPKDAPTLLLLHGLPSSSRMFEPLLSRLSSRDHLVAPGYPGFGHSDWPDSKSFAYTFDRDRQPRLLVIWGKYDLSFDPSEPFAYARGVRDAEVHVLQAGHFALDTAADEIAVLVRNFLGSVQEAQR